MGIGQIIPTFNPAMSAYQSLEPIALSADFAMVHVANDPTGVAYKVTGAKEVLALLTFAHDGRDIVLHGRWGGSTKQVAALKPGEARETLDTIDFAPTGQRKELDFALKYVDDEHAYAYSNESPDLAPVDFRASDFQLNGSSIKLRVELRGDGIDDPIEWRFILTHNGKGSRMKVAVDRDHAPTVTARTGDNE